MRAPRARGVVLAGLLVAALSTAATGAGDTAHTPPADPDPGFLEFLGSVDGLAEVSPDYLAQAGPGRAARLTVKDRSPPARPPPAARAPDPSVEKNE